MDLFYKKNLKSTSLDFSKYNPYRPEDKTGTFMENYAAARDQMFTSGRSDSMGTVMYDAYQDYMSSRMKNEIDALKKTTEYKRADSDTQKKLEEKKIKQFAKERERLAFFEKSASFAEASINIAQALTSPAVMINPFLQALVAFIPA